MTKSLKTMNQNEIVGQNIRLFREKMGLTQEQMSNYLGISRETMNYFENGKRSIPTEIISKASDLFGIEEYDLFENETDEQYINLAFSFRAEQILVEDLKQIAEFRKIVKNYIMMKKKLYDKQSIN